MGAQVNKQSQRELVTPAEYARRRGVTRAAVSKAILRCQIPLVDGLLDPLVADTLWKARTDPDQQRRALAQNLHKPAEVDPAKPDGRNDNWRERRDKAEAQLAELQLQEREGALVKKAEVEKSAKRLASAIVQQLQAIPDRIAAEFGVDDAGRLKLRQRLTEELNLVRAEFARAGLAAES